MNLSQRAVAVADRLRSTPSPRLRRAVHYAMGLPGVGSALEELHYRVLERTLPQDAAVNTDTPLPPRRLRYSVTSATGMSDPAGFVETGRAHAAILREAATAAAGEVPSPILDLGCGVGRVLVHMRAPGLELHGCDINADAIAWSRDNLPGEFRVNDLEPPLPYDDAYFGLVYAISVFTHLPAGLQRTWIEELHRVVRPGGLVLITTHGETVIGVLTPAERRQFEQGELVVRGSLVAGSNRCNTYHPERYLRELVDGRFELGSIEPAAVGNQDLVTLRRAA